MKTIQLMVLALTLILSLSTYAEAETAGSIKILLPVDGSQLDAGETYPLSYEVTIGTGSDHFHVWVDDKRGPGIHDTKGTYKLPKMTPGEHTIMIKLVAKDHNPTGPEKSIKVMATR
ncbi:MAG: hypothetical protein HYR79_02625 [Nitrospirae bacterium]|nr:hypothetical protein [Nitrospirota bacterium]